MLKPATRCAVLFDLDGTLVDTIGDITYALNAALEAAGVPSVTYDTCKQFVGRGLRNALLNALQAAQVAPDEAQLDSLVEVMLKTYQKYPFQRAVVYPHIEALLDKSVASGLQLGVLSNKDDDLVQEIVQALFPKVPFISVQGASTTAPLKPDPTTALQFAQQAGCTVEEVLLVGDTEVDYYTAQEAGMPVAIATWGFRSRPELEAAGCKPLYDSVSHLAKEVFPWL